jgi:hypothetical protein
MQLWQLPFFAALSAAVSWMIWRVVKEQQKARREEEAQREEARRQLRERGEMLPDGRMACLVCLKAAATDPYPVLTRSKLDRDLLGHRALYHQTPMYVIEDDAWGGPALCAPHKRMLVRKLEQKLSEIRTRTANLNSQIEEELAAFETIELITWARMECDRSVQAVQQALDKSTERLLPAASQSSSGAGVTVRLIPTEGEDSSDKD